MRTPDPSNLEPAVSECTEPKVSKTPTTTTYLCPVCGKSVDVTDPEEILLHHEHVTHPRDFLLERANQTMDQRRKACHDPVRG